MKYARSMALIRGVVLRSPAGRTRKVCAGKGAREQVPDVGRLQRMVSHGDDQDDQDDHLIDIRRIDDEQGWGFVACCDIDEGQALVSVPLSQTITGLDDPGMALPWSLQMVEQLLVRKYEDSAEPWMDSLPVHVDLPFLYWHDDDIARLGDPAFIREIVSLRAFYRSPDVRAYFSEYDWEDVMWGVAMVHSRSFVYSEGKHRRSSTWPTMTTCRTHVCGSSFLLIYAKGKWQPTRLLLLVLSWIRRNPVVYLN
jgi:hypothetical protein